MSEHMNDRQFAKAFAGMVAAMMGLAFVFMVLAYLVSGDVRERMQAEKQVDNDRILAARIQPVGVMSVGTESIVESIVPAANADAAPGQATYDSVCAACHATGVAGAPAVGDASHWTERIAQGTETLEEHAITGYQGQAGFMPAKGGNTALSDDEVKAAVAYMVEQSQ